jgi:hypothetical protein
MSQKPAEPMALGVEAIAMTKRFGDFTAPTTCRSR